MGLTAVLVDRARLHERRPSQVRINGRTTFTEVTGAWFKARVEVDTENETGGAGDANQRVEDRITLMFGIKDSQGQPLALTTEALIEVDSKQFGRHLYRVASDPLAYRKKRKIIGGEAALQRIEEHEYEVLPSAPVVTEVGRSLVLRYAVA